MLNALGLNPDLTHCVPAASYGLADAKTGEVKECENKTDHPAPLYCLLMNPLSHAVTKKSDR